MNHAAGVRSWLESANDHDSGFSLSNLPLGVFSSGDPSSARIGIAAGDQILDIRACVEAELLQDVRPAALIAATAGDLNLLMRLGRGAARELTAAVRRLLAHDAAAGIVEKVRTMLVRAEEATLHVPAQIGDYTDFYASLEHATNVGSMFRPDNPLLPNYKHIPIGYHGRASSIVASGTSVRRPLGQTKPADAAEPHFGPSRALDYEAEIGFYVARGNAIGDPVSIDAADERIFGFCLVNDWSARDIQSWEYQPLGPFLSKNFATTVSPWVVLTDALEPFRVPARRREDGDPEPLPYLRSASDRERGAFAIRIETWLLTARMREAGEAPHRLSIGDFERMYWTPAQMLTHHASSGCNLVPGDLLASGTVSGPVREQRGCLLEITRRGAEPVVLPGGDVRSFLEDGDEVILRGWCRRPGVAALSLGECRGTVAEPRGDSAVL
ncbi:MAG TPA: fumarylacetoacetase [Gemmatimonadaceae bacterium]|nr:fumarylacetoacetase [Gemmatimonadaceae bacterium]